MKYKYQLGDTFRVQRNCLMNGDLYKGSIFTLTNHLDRGSIISGPPAYKDKYHTRVYDQLDVSAHYLGVIEFESGRIREARWQVCTKHIDRALEEGVLIQISGNIGKCPYCQGPLERASISNRDITVCQECFREII